MSSKFRHFHSPKMVSDRQGHSCVVNFSSSVFLYNCAAVDKIAEFDANIILLNAECYSHVRYAC